jgi:hypothetical protein
MREGRGLESETGLKGENLDQGADSRWEGGGWSLPSPWWSPGEREGAALLRGLDRSGKQGARLLLLVTGGG